MTFFISLSKYMSWVDSEKEAISKLLMLKNKSDKEFLLAFCCDDMEYVKLSK